MIYVLAAPGLSRGTQEVLVGAHKVSAAACGIQLPDQGPNPGLLNWEHRVLPLDRQGSLPSPASSVVY